MSNIALAWAYKCHVGNASAKAILVYLADRANDDGTAAFPKVETIEQVTEFSHSTVRGSRRTCCFFMTTTGFPLISFLASITCPLARRQSLDGWTQ